jgi:cytochrome c-type biogenesis protein CcmH/NrfF
MVSVLPALSALLVVLHLGALHPVEQGLTVLLAFGPFVLLGVVIWVRRRQDARDDERQESVDQAPAQRER